MSQTPAMVLTRLPALCVALVAPVLGALIYFVLLAGQPIATVAYGAVKLLMVVWPLACLAWWRSDEPPRPQPTLKPMPTIRVLGEGLLTGLLMAAGCLALIWGPMSGVLRASSGVLLIRIREAHMADTQGYVLGSLAISTVHSAFEEYYWRWFVFGQLRLRLPTRVSMVIGSIGFAAHHVVIASVFCGVLWGIFLGLVVGCAGLVWTIMYRRHGSLLGAWIAHACCDGALMVVGWRILHPSSDMVAVVSRHLVASTPWG